MNALIAQFKARYVTPAEDMEEPDPLLVTLDELLTRLLAVATAAQQMQSKLETECPHCGAHEIGGATAHTDDCVAELLCSALADLAQFEADLPEDEEPETYWCNTCKSSITRPHTCGAGLPTVLSYREGEPELSSDDLKIMGELVGGVDVFSPGKARQIRILARRHPGLIDITEAMGEYGVREIHPFFGAILTDEGQDALNAGQSAARPCALELDEVAGG